jgi:hypothetical protein
MEALVDCLLERYEQNPECQGRAELAEARAALSAGQEWEASELIDQLHRPPRNEMVRIVEELEADEAAGPFAKLSSSFSRLSRVRAALNAGDEWGAWRELSLLVRPQREACIAAGEGGTEVSEKKDAFIAPSAGASLLLWSSAPSLALWIRGSSA